MTTTRTPARRLAATVAAGGLLLTGAAGVAAIPSSGSAAVAHRAPAVHAAKATTLTFVSVTKSELDAGPTDFISHSIDKQGSKTIGYDLLSGKFNPKTERVTLHIAVALKGGLMFVEIVGQGGAENLNGTITGGSGKFKGAKGTVKAKNLDDEGQRTRVTLTYQL